MEGTDNFLGGLVSNISFLKEGNTWRCIKKSGEDIFVF